MAPTPAKPSSATAHDRDANPPSPRLDLDIRLDQAMEIHRSRSSKWTMQDVTSLLSDGKTVFVSHSDGEDFGIVLLIKWHVCGVCTDEQLGDIHKELLAEAAVHADFCSKLNKTLKKAINSSNGDSMKESRSTTIVMMHRQSTLVQLLSKLSEDNVPLNQLASKLLQPVLIPTIYQPNPSALKRSAADEAPGSDSAQSTQLAKRPCTGLPGLFTPTPIPAETVDPALAREMMQRLAEAESLIKYMDEYIRDQLQECGMHTYEICGIEQKMRDAERDSMQSTEKLAMLVSAKDEFLMKMGGIEQAVQKGKATVAGLDAKVQVMDGGSERFRSEMAEMKAVMFKQQAELSSMRIEMNAMRKEMTSLRAKDACLAELKHTVQGLQRAVDGIMTHKAAKSTAAAVVAEQADYISLTESSDKDLAHLLDRLVVMANTIRWHFVSPTGLIRSLAEKNGLKEVWVSMPGKIEEEERAAARAVSGWTGRSDDGGD